MEVDTARLILRPWSEEHLGALVVLNADPEVARYLGGRPFDPAESAALSERLVEHWEQHGYGLWAVVEKRSGETLGFAGLSHPVFVPELAEEVEVGWRLDRSAWGRGYATEAGAEALRWAFGELGLARVVAIIDPDNAASLAVARKLGMTLGGRVLHPERGTPLELLERRQRSHPPEGG